MFSKTAESEIKLHKNKLAEEKNLNCDAMFKKVSNNNNSDAKLASSEKSHLTVRSIVAIFLVLSSMFFNGTIYGYMSPALLSMQQQSSPTKSSRDNSTSTFLPSDVEASWVSSLSSIGFIFGGLISGVSMRLFGRKYSSIFGLGLSYMIGYALISFAPIKVLIFAGRFVGGVCQGFCNCVTTLYVLELCTSSRQKSICGILLSLFGNFGTLITYLLGVFLDWRQLALTLMVLGGPYIIGMLIFVPETQPPEPFTCKNYSTCMCRNDNCRNYSEEELKKVKNENSISTSSLNNSDTTSTCIILKVSKKFQTILKFYQPVLSGVFLIFFIQFGGYNIVSLFATTIIQMDMKANTSEPLVMNQTNDVFDEEDCSSMARLGRTALWAAVGVALAGLVGVLAGVALVHLKCNRKKMLVVSALGIFAAFTGLGTFLILTNEGRSADESVTRWVITVALILHLLLFNIGFGCLGFPVAAEIMPSHFRSKGMSVITASAGIFGFLNSKSYHDLKYYAGSGETFIIYGTINFIAAIFIQFTIPDL